MTCYNTFYHPSNMLLFVVGGVDPQEVIDMVRSNQAQKDYKPQGEIIQRLFEPEPRQVGGSQKGSEAGCFSTQMSVWFKETRGWTYSGNNCCDAI